MSKLTREYDRGLKNVQEMYTQELFLLEDLRGRELNLIEVNNLSIL